LYRFFFIPNKTKFYDMLLISAPHDRLPYQTYNTPDSKKNLIIENGKGQDQMANE
jgi:hypothetical protein